MVNGRYGFAPSADPQREQAAQAFHAAELAAAGALVADGAAAVRTTYADGGQNAIFAALLKKGADLGTVSRPEALAYAGIDVTLVAARRHPRPVVSAAVAALTAVKPTARSPGDAPAAVPPAVAAPLDTVSTGSLRASLPPLPHDAAVLKAHPADRPVDAAALGDAPMHYAVYKPPQVVALIAGAMPMRLPTWTY